MLFLETIFTPQLDKKYRTGTQCNTFIDITFDFLASAALTCAGVLRIGALVEEELLALLFASSFGSSVLPPRPTEPGPFFFTSGVFTEKVEKIHVLSCTKVMI